MSTVYLGLGTNIGDRIMNLNLAVEGLAEKVMVTAVSPVYETNAWGVEDQPDFLNMCVAGETDLAPEDLLHYVKRLEKRLGRIPSEHWGPRTIDIDILFFDSLMFESPELSIPHAGIADRASVLVPLADIAPNLQHPISLRRIIELSKIVDRSGVRLFSSA